MDGIFDVSYYIRQELSCLAIGIAHQMLDKNPYRRHVKAADMVMQQTC